MKNNSKIVILIFTLLFTLFNGKIVLAHDHFGYSHDENIGYENKNWMSKLPDEVKLSQLSIPGTHDSMSLYGGDIPKTQSMNLSTQLNSGIRFLDIRCRYINESTFSIHHGSVYQNAMFGDVLRESIEFLKANPSETILMRVKREYEPEVYTKFYNTFMSYVKRNKSWFWDNGGNSNKNPTLGEMRGKIVVLYDATGDFGINYNILNKQDYWKLSDNWDLYNKWEKVKAQLKKANASPNDGQIYLNYLSGSTGSFPYFVASGHSNPATGAPRLATGFTTPGWKNKYPDFPRVNEFLGISTIAFEGTNVLTTNELLFSKYFGTPYSRVGIIAADFPGAGLINYVIETNNNLIKK